MITTILYTVAALSSLGLLAALVLYVISRKFHVEEDPRLEQIEEVLPSANCGGCGYPGCKGFAEAALKAGSLEDLNCPAGGNEVMKQVAEILGVEAVEHPPFVAVVKCAGTLSMRPKTSFYDGPRTCHIEHSLYSGETDCEYGCLGEGDCAAVCDFDALHMDPVTGLPVVTEDKCTACNKCVTECPRDIMSLWPQGRKNRKIYVACMNEEKGGTARKYCSAACSACAKCADVCKYDAINIASNLASIDPDLCKLCRKCEDVCDASNIMAINFPERKPRPERKERPAKTERPPREKRVAKTDKSDIGATTAARERPERPARKERAERPARERKPAAQRPPREKRATRERKTDSDTSENSIQPPKN